MKKNLEMTNQQLPRGPFLTIKFTLLPNKTKRESKYIFNLPYFHLHIDWGKLHHLILQGSIKPIYKGLETGICRGYYTDPNNKFLFAM